MSYETNLDEKARKGEFREIFCDRCFNAIGLTQAPEVPELEEHEASEFITLCSKCHDFYFPLYTEPQKIYREMMNALK